MMMVPIRQTAQIRSDLDQLAARGTRWLARWSLHKDLRLAIRDALWFVPVAPIVILLIDAWLWLLDRTRLSLHASIGLLTCLIGPSLFVLIAVASRTTRRRFDRRIGLSLFDSYLCSHDRLVTADEFLRAALLSDSATDQFKHAAIEDAAAHAKQALLANPMSSPLPAWSISKGSWMAIPAAALALTVGLVLSPAPARTRPAADEIAATEATPAATLPAGPFLKLLPTRESAPRRSSHIDQERSDGLPAQPSADRSTSDRTDGDAGGQSHAGGQVNSRSTSRNMTSSGVPSNQQAPSKAVDDEPAGGEQVPTTISTKKPNLKKAETQSASATSGQGQSKSSISDMNRIPATDQPDRAGANKDDGKDEGGIQDETEEEKTSGVERPSLRRNKPPVDRNLSPLPSDDNPNPFANGRTGPGNRKKTRGVPAMILGVPTPDRIQGMTNPGQSKITQERSSPQEESYAAAAAEARLAREKAFGAVDHPRLRPWMQTLIETYFLHIRGHR